MRARHHDLGSSLKVDGSVMRREAAVHELRKVCTVIHDAETFQLTRHPAAISRREIVAAP